MAKYGEVRSDMKGEAVGHEFSKRLECHHDHDDNVGQ